MGQILPHGRRRRRRHRAPPGGWEVSDAAGMQAALEEFLLVVLEHMHRVGDDLTEVLDAATFGETVFLSGHRTGTNAALLKQHGITRVLNVDGVDTTQELREAGFHGDVLILRISDTPAFPIEMYFDEAFAFLRAPLEKAAEQAQAQAAAATTAAAPAATATTAAASPTAQPAASWTASWRRGGSRHTNKVAAAAAPPRTLVHCQLGVSRSPTIVIAYLMRYHDMSLWDAVELVVTRRGSVAPNMGFAQKLIRFAHNLHRL